jgi:hypothetical protein
MLATSGDSRRATINHDTRHHIGEIGVRSSLGSTDLLTTVEIPHVQPPGPVNCNGDWKISERSARYRPQGIGMAKGRADLSSGA